MRHKYIVWSRYGKGEKQSDIELNLTDEEAKLIYDHMDDPYELRRVDDTDISYLWEY